jgi:hypothetical protein
MILPIVMADLTKLGDNLIQQCYPKNYKPSHADKTFSRQMKMFHGNRALLLDVLEKQDLRKVKRMVKQDVHILFCKIYLLIDWLRLSLLATGKYCFCTDISETAERLAERNRVLRNWPKAAPLPSMLHLLKDRDMAATIFLGIWTKVISINKGAFHPVACCARTDARRPQQMIPSCRDMSSSSSTPESFTARPRHSSPHLHRL